MEFQVNYRLRSMTSKVGDEMFGYVKELVGEQGTMMLPQIMGGKILRRF